jgi:hypothetical protein
MRGLFAGCCLAVCALAASAAPVRGAFHFWDIKEIFTSADGAVQFIEFVCGPFSGEHFLNGHDLTATSDGVPVSFTFNANLNQLQSTSNRHFLAATPGFASLTGGITPNYTIPANFFNPNASSITINFAHSTDIVTLAGSLLPKDGVNSLTDQSPAGATNLVAGANSPTNFAGTVGSVNVGTPGDPADLNGDGDVDGDDLDEWRTAFAMTDDGDVDGDDDSDGEDFLRWQRANGATTVAAVGAVPEPATGWLASVAVLMAALRRRHSDKLARV